MSGIVCFPKIGENIEFKREIGVYVYSYELRQWAKNNPSIGYSDKDSDLILPAGLIFTIGKFSNNSNGCNFRIFKKYQIQFPNIVGKLSGSINFKNFIGQEYRKID